MRPDRKRNRLAGFDYSKEAFYFVTSCVKDMDCVFGEVIQEEMHLNLYGQIAERQWFWLIEQYPYLSSHAFVVMPNHIHGLLEIHRKDEGSEVGGGDQECLKDQNCVDDQQCDMDQLCVDDRECFKDQECAGTGRDLSVLGYGGEIKSLSHIMGAYKTTTSKLIRQAGLPDFAWHRSFHDHIIRNEKGFRNIKHYIENNPAKWNEDTFRR